MSVLAYSHHGSAGGDLVDMLIRYVLHAAVFRFLWHLPAPTVVVVALVAAAAFLLRRRRRYARR